MLSSEELLQNAAADGTMESAEWPRAFETIQSRLDHIVYHEFPIPPIPLPEPLPSSVEETPAPATNPETVSSQDSRTSQVTNKENAPPSSPPLRPPVPPFPVTPVNQPARIVPSNSLQPPQNTLPPGLLSLYQSVQGALTTQFSKNPPHTVQRLAELVLHPRADYRFLPAYLNALDRVLSVSSGLSAFPLSGGTQPSSAGGGGLLNGDNAASGLGSDESLGGALLTPIPWLKNQGDRVNVQPVEHSRLVNGLGDAGHASVATNGINSTIERTGRGEAVTQGELLRQEQQAGIIPTAESTSGVMRVAPSETASTDTGEHPHARGPSEMTMEDLGPQERSPGGALDMEAAVGRSVVRQEERGNETLNAKVEEAVMQARANLEDEARKAENEGDDRMDEDTIVTDVDGKTEEDMMDVDASGDNTMPDAVDTTTR